MKKYIIISFIGIMIVALGFKFAKSEKKTTGDFKTVPVTRGTVIEKALAIGKITPLNEIQVKSKIAGNVQKIYANVGDKISAGQPLAEIIPDPTPLQITESRRNVELARVTYDQARNEFLRQKELLARNLISRQEFEKQKMAYEEAKLRKKLAEEKLAILIKGKVSSARNKVESVIRAPVSGTVLEKFVNVGDPVVPLTPYQAGTPLFTLADMSQLIFRGTIDEIDVGKVRLGMPAEIKIGALPSKKIKGIVSLISPKAKKEDNATLFDIEISIVKVGSLELRAGYSANADIIIRKAENVLTLPERLVTFKNDSAFVEVLDSLGKPRKKTILLGLSDGVTAQITSGLKENEPVIERPPKEIK